MFHKCWLKIVKREEEEEEESKKEETRNKAENATGLRRRLGVKSKRDIINDNRAFSRTIKGKWPVEVKDDKSQMAEIER